MSGNLGKSCARVVAVAAVVFAEVTEGKTIQMPAMGGIAKGAVIGVMGCCNDGAASGSEQAVELLHRADDVRDVLNDMRRPDFAERTVGERKGEMVEVGYDVGAGVWIAV